MRLIQYLNDRVKRLTIFDIKLVQGCAMCIAIILAILIPEILTISIWWYVGLIILMGIRPVYVFFFSGQ